MRDLMDLPHPTGAGPDGLAPQDDPFDQEQVSEDEQAQYDQFVEKSLRFIHHPETRDHIIDQLNDRSVSVPESVGRVAALVARTVAEHAKAQEVELSPDVVFHAGTEIVQELMEVGARAGIFPIEWPEEGEELSPEVETMMEQAFAIGAHEYGKHLVASEEGQSLADEAGTFFAQQVAKEADAGILDPSFAGGKNPEIGRRALIEDEGVDNG